MRITWLAAACAAMSAVSTGAQSSVFDVLAYGAVGDGRHYDTAAIRAAFAAADAAGGGTVLFKAGYTFLTGHFNLSANTVVAVEGTIFGSPNNTDYILVEPLPWYGAFGMLPNNGQGPSGLEWAPLVQSWYVDNITITGGGVIDGNGAAWWACAGDLSQAPCDGYVRPHGVRLVGSTGVHVYNVTIQNSPMWQLHLAYVTDAHIHDATILAPSGSHNTDGIDPDCAQNVLIERMNISVGDDCIAIKAGRDWNGRTYGRPSANITIRDSVFGQGHGLSVGSEMSGGVQNVLFSNLTAIGTDNGIRLKSERGRGGLITNITYENIVLVNITGEVIQMTLNYDPGIPPTNATGTPVMDGVTVRNVTAIDPVQGWFLDGLPESQLQGLVLQDVHIINAHKLIQGCDNVDMSHSSCTDVTPSCPPCMANSTGRVEEAVRVAATAQPVANFTACAGTPGPSQLWNYTGSPSTAGALRSMVNNSMCLVPLGCANSTGTALGLAPCSSQVDALASASGLRGSASSAVAYGPTCPGVCQQWMFDTFTFFTFTHVASGLLMTDNGAGLPATIETAQQSPAQAYQFNPQQMTIQPADNSNLCLTALF